MASITDQNWVVWNQGKNPLVNFNFMLRVELLFDLPCKSVRAFSRELEYDYIQEGGLNDYVHMRRKPITRPFTLEVERYVGVDYLDPLPLGTDLTLPVLLFVSRNHDQFIPGVVARTYVFTGCTVMKKTYGDLVADQSGLLVETTTLGYREMLCVDIPWSEVGDDISKDIATVPTNAKTLDKTAAQLKAMGQDLYLKAQAAREQAQDEFAAADAETLVTELEDTLKQLQAAIAQGGAFTQQVQRAQAGLNGEGGATKKDLANQAVEAAQQAEREAKEKEALLREQDNARRRRQDEQNRLQEKREGPAGRVQDLTARLEQDRADRAALEQQLPADLRTESAAQAAVAEAQRALDAAETALDAARQRRQEAVSAAQQQEEQIALRKNADDAAADVAARQGQRDEAASQLDQAQQEYNTALRAWQESQNDQLERIGVRRAEREERVQERQRALRRIQRERAEDAEPSDEETRAIQALEAAQEELKQVQQEEADLQSSIAAGPQDERSIERREAIEAAQTKLEQAQTALDEAQEKADSAQNALQSAQAAQEDQVRKSEIGQAEQAAENTRNEAKRTLDAAQVNRQRCQELAALTERIDREQEELAQAQAEVQSVEQEIASAAEAENQASAAYNDAQAAWDTARAQAEKARSKADAARQAAAQADQDLAAAQERYQRANRQVNPLQNSLVNLKLRKDTGAQAQTDCSDQHDKCKTANDELQAMDEGNLSQVNTAYETVKKFSKQTCFHERQVRDVVQHMQAARKLLSEVEIPEVQ